MKTQTLLKTFRHSDEASWVGSNSSWYSDTKRSDKFWTKKNVKIKKKAHTFKGYASSSNVEILNYFNPELQLKDTKSAIKNKF